MDVRGMSGRLRVKPGGTAEVELLSQHMLEQEFFYLSARHNRRTSDARKREKGSAT
jgi:hypothetical protein